MDLAIDQGEMILGSWEARQGHWLTMGEAGDGSLMMAKAVVKATSMNPMLQHPNDQSNMRKRFRGSSSV